MKYLGTLLFCFALIACGSGTSLKADPDTAGKTPNDYIVDYYQAVNADDYAALQAMCTKGYYKSIVTKQGFLKTPDPDLFKQTFERKMFKHDSYTITDKRSGFHDNNAKGVYSVGTKVMFSAAYKPIFEKMNGFKSEHINDEVCFKIENGLWKVTDKIKGH